MVLVLVVVHQAQEDPIQYLQPLLQLEVAEVLLMKGLIQMDQEDLVVVVVVMLLLGHQHLEEIKEQEILHQ